MRVITVSVPKWLFGIMSTLFSLGLGGAVGATVFWYGPYARLERQLRDAQAVIESKDQRLSEIRSQLDRALADYRRAREELKQKDLELASARGELKQKDLELASARVRLGQKEREKQAAVREVARQRSIVLSKERDIYVLRTCLVGIGASYVHYSREEYHEAVDALRSVERECEAAMELVK